MANLSEKSENLLMLMASQHQQAYGVGMFSPTPIDLDAEFQKMAAPITTAQPMNTSIFNFDQHGLA